MLGTHSIVLSLVEDSATRLSITTLSIVAIRRHCAEKFTVVMLSVFTLSNVILEVKEPSEAYPQTLSWSKIIF